MKTQVELDKEYNEVELIETAIMAAPGWDILKNKVTQVGDNPEDKEIYVLYYNSELNKSVKIIKNPFRRTCSMSNVEVKELNSNNEENNKQK